MSFPDPFGPPPIQQPPSPLDQLIDWVREEGAWWASSFVFHMFLMIALMVVGSKYLIEEDVAEAPSFAEAEVPAQAAATELDLEHFEMSTEPMDPSELSPDRLDLEPGPMIEEKETIYHDDSPIFTEEGGGRPNTGLEPALGGLGGFDVMLPQAGIAFDGAGGVGSGEGTGDNPGVGGAGVGFGGRGTGSKEAMVGGFGGTRKSERAVAAALFWLHRHQSADGHWSLKGFETHCKDDTCREPKPTLEADIAATSMGLLPFLAAGQTHNSKGPYRQAVYRGLDWLMRKQKPDGAFVHSLDTAVSHRHYAHGLAAITLCEAYGLTKDKLLRDRAQRSINFIESIQHSAGGWRYEVGQPADTSVTGWMVMALKSAQMAGLDVKPESMDNVKPFLKAVSSGGNGGIFAYYPSYPPSNGMTGVGLLCNQYLGVHRDSPMMIEGVRYLASNLPDPGKPDVYYWYYATQAMHNVPGPDWDTWNRRMRRVLIESQVQEGCARGSWNPSGDPQGSQGGRLMQTSLSVLTLEVYYRYLPLYQLEGSAPAGQPILTIDASKGEKK